MFIMSFKLNKTKVATFVMICALVAALLLILAPDAGLTAGSKETAVHTNDDRLTFIKSFGWEIKNEPVEIEEVTIPTVFDEVYEKYNLLQKDNGYDFTKYQGKRVKRYTYEVTNYPERPGEIVRLNLFVYNDRVIGGDVSSTSLSGFMHGFKKPGSASSKASSSKAASAASSKSASSSKSTSSKKSGT